MRKLPVLKKLHKKSNGLDGRKVLREFYEIIKEAYENESKMFRIEEFVPILKGGKEGFFHKDALVIKVKGRNFLLSYGISKGEESLLNDRILFFYSEEDIDREKAKDIIKKSYNLKDTILVSNYAGELYFGEVQKELNKEKVSEEFSSVIEKALIKEPIYDEEYYLVYIDGFHAPMLIKPASYKKSLPKKLLEKLDSMMNFIEKYKND